MPNSNSKILDKLTSKNIIYILIIGFLCISLCIYDLRWIIPSIFIYAAIIIYSMWVTGKKKTEIENHIKAVTSDVDTASKGNLINTPIPLVLIETNGNIIWRSKKFVTEFQNIDVGTYLNQIVKEIKLDIEKNDETIEITKQFNIDKKVYRIRGSVVKAKRRDKKKQKEYILSLYFINETKYNELFDAYNNSRPCIGIAMIDNYEDIIQRILPEKKIELLAKIEREIIDWVTKTGGLIIKTERDTFIYVFEQQYLAEFEKEKFNILDKVKSIDIDEKIQVTLSIAISTEGNSNFEKYKSALTAMEIVLGRGGDQVVVRKDGKYKFYGGKTLEVEKRTKVKARTISQSISRIIDESDNVVIMGHRNIDIDAFGAALGLYRLSKTLGKECYIASEPTGKSLGKFLDKLKTEEEYKDIILNEEEVSEVINKNTLLIIVDTHKTSYVEFPELLNKIDRKIIIDHHRKAPDCIENVLISFHEVYASSTAELVTEIIQYSKEDITLNLIEAESLYGGIMVDTKDFTFKTGVRTFEAAAYLRKYGVDIIRVKKWFQADLESYNMIANIVKNVEIHNDTIAVAVYDAEDENANLICAKAADELLTISDITASFVMAKMGEKVCISGRSIGDINVQLILEKLGGGGHITLAGAQLEGFSLEDAKDELVIRINEYLLETE
ncbi:MAG: DHH family phosphoesterase [Clostridia bacterium]|nr:DHH family phosphoesterase [Clostridia bacterium]